jgi:hypothetical protein
MRKVGPEFDAMDNEKGLDGSRPITEAIATRQGDDVPPERGKRGTADAAQALAQAAGGHVGGAIVLTP